MQPRTKIQKRVVELRKKLKPVKDSVFYNMLRKELYSPRKYSNHWYQSQMVAYPVYKHRGKNGKIWCRYCGEAFTLNELKANHYRCPKCGEKINPENIVEGNNLSESMSFFMASLDHIEDFFVFRLFDVSTNSKKGRKISFGTCEVMDVFVNRTHTVVMATQRNSFTGEFSHWGGDMEIRQYHQSYGYYNRDYMDYRATCIDASRVKKYFGLDCGNIRSAEILRTVVRNPIIETLLKSDKSYWVSDYIYSGLPDDILAAYKVMWRHKYNLSKEDLPVWMQYFGNLRQLDKDLRNPKYICPANVAKAKAESDMAIAKIREKQERERRRRAMMTQEQRDLEDLQKCGKENEAYIKRRRKFYPMTLMNDHFYAKVLKDIKDFYDEGTQMDHCVFRCQYYKKPDSLILSVRDIRTDKRLETCEVRLDTMRINQLYAIHDTQSKYHNDIRDFIDANMNKIKLFNQLKTA